MPIYEYECRRCGHEFETIQKFSDAPLRKCPECAKLSLHKKVTAASFHLKGSGWYVTDFRDKGGKSDAKGAKSKGNGGSKSEGKSESKGESKSETKSDSAGAGKSDTKSGKKTDSKAAAG